LEKPDFFEKSGFLIMNEVINNWSKLPSIGKTGFFQKNPVFVNNIRKSYR